MSRRKPETPAVAQPGDLVLIGDQRYKLADPDVSSDGSATVVVRKTQ